MSIAAPAAVRSGRRDPFLWGVVGATTAVRAFLAWRFFGFLGGDDVEILQEAFRVAAGLEYVPWNLRNLLLPDLIVAPVVRLAAWVGVGDVGALAFVATWPFIALASLNTVLVYRLADAWLEDRWTARVAALIYACHWLPLAYGSTVYPRTATTTCVLLAALALTGPGRDAARGWGAGAAMGAAFAFRYSEGMYLLPLVALCAPAAGDRSRFRARAAALAGGFAVAALAMVAISDAAAWGTPFASLAHLWSFMVRGVGDAGLSRRPPWFYLARLLFWLTPALIPALVLAGRQRRVRWAWGFVATPLVLLGLIAHKELRYLQGAIPFLAVLGAAGFAVMKRRWRPWIAAALLAVTLVSGAFGARILAGKSMAAVTAARRLAADATVRVAALSQSWAYGGNLVLGNRVEVRDLPTPPGVEALRAAAAGADVVALYRKDVDKDPALAAALAGAGFAERERIAWGESKVVVLFRRTPAR